MADRLEVVGHACRAVDDADVFGSAVLARGLVDDVADLGKPSRLEPVAPIGSSVAVRTSGDLPFKTSKGVRFIELFFCLLRHVLLLFWPASRSKPAFANKVVRS
jgi:hypothetical protein